MHSQPKSIPRIFAAKEGFREMAAFVMELDSIALPNGCSRIMRYSFYSQLLNCQLIYVRMVTMNITAYDTVNLLFLVALAKPAGNYLVLYYKSIV